jgi:hypothetical protein
MGQTRREEERAEDMAHITEAIVRGPAMKGTASVILSVLCSCILGGCNRGLTSDEAKRVIENKILAYHSVSVDAISSSSPTEAIVRATIGDAVTVNLKLRKDDKGWIWESVETKGGSWVDPGLLALAQLIQTISPNCIRITVGQGTITASDGATWSLSPTQQTLRNGVQVGGGLGSVMVITAGQIQVQGALNNLWYVFLAGGWLPTDAGDPCASPRSR